ncbi:hypothetical protein PVAP13_2KG388605 [Panicum virgatum]|uniref:Uncharacterized protein n=1 Tax=Panicum virgatum TaxID=38727 RepID=A0A8T0W904_PANVG|nr:hypothetical protein PVAP13_2KG388605 [Panicum virgatum]
MDIKKPCTFARGHYTYYFILFNWRATLNDEITPTILSSSHSRYHSSERAIRTPAAWPTLLVRHASERRTARTPAARPALPARRTARTPEAWPVLPARCVREGLTGRPPPVWPALPAQRANEGRISTARLDLEVAGVGVAVARARISSSIKSKHRKEGFGCETHAGARDEEDGSAYLLLLPPPPPRVAVAPIKSQAPEVVRGGAPRRRARWRAWPSKRLSTVLPVAELDLEPGGASTGVARREETQLGMGAGRGYKRRRAADAR